MTGTIKETIRGKRTYEAELDYLLNCSSDTDAEKLSVLTERVVFLQRQLALISSWMKLLSDDEAFVTQRHLIDGIDIPRIVVEYEAKWGKEFAKSERTIKTYQQRAIKHIAEFEQQKQEINHN